MPFMSAMGLMFPRYIQSRLTAKPLFTDHKKNRCEGQYSVLDVNGEDIMFLIPPPSGPNKYRLTVLKRYFFPISANSATIAGIQTVSKPLQSTMDKRAYLSSPVPSLSSTRYLSGPFHSTIPLSPASVFFEPLALTTSTIPSCFSARQVCLRELATAVLRPFEYKGLDP